MMNALDHGDVQIVDWSSFGYKTSWFSISTTDVDEVKLDFLSLKLKATLMVKEDFVLAIVEPIDVVPFSLIREIDEETDSLDEFFNQLNERAVLSSELNQALVHLSEKYGLACYFQNYRISDSYAWVKYINGQCVRAFEYQEGYCNVLNFGLPSVDEIDGDLDFLNLNTDILNEDEFVMPNEEDVIEIASIWTVSPLR